MILSISCSESSRTSWRWQRKRRPGRIGSPECLTWLTCKNKIREKWMSHGAQLDYLSTFNSIRKGSVFENVFIRSFLVENPFGPCLISSHLQYNILTIFHHDRIVSARVLVVLSTDIISFFQKWLWFVSNGSPASV